MPCPICLDREPNITLSNCGHQFCSQCVAEFTKPQQITYDYGNPNYAFNVNLPTGCPLCRKKVASVDKSTSNWRNWQDKGGGGRGRGGGTGPKKPILG